MNSAWLHAPRVGNGPNITSGQCVASGSGASGRARLSGLAGASGCHVRPVAVFVQAGRQVAC
jgi:hypothetical protein